MVSDRAATSLGLVVARGDREAVPLKPRIAAALKDLYRQLGDGCRRTDAGWGYRPIDNALLKLGSEGEEILRGFVEQTTDRLLAEHVWRSLFIRQDNGTYSEVTEPEDEEAFRHYPAWLSPRIDKVK